MYTKQYFPLSKNVNSHERSQFLYHFLNSYQYLGQKSWQNMGGAHGQARCQWGHLMPVCSRLIQLWSPLLDLHVVLRPWCPVISRTCCVCLRSRRSRIKFSSDAISVAMNRAKTRPQKRPQNAPRIARHWCDLRWRSLPPAVPTRDSQPARVNRRSRRRNTT